MTTIQWNAFQKFREEYRELCFSWNKNEKELFVLQKEAADLKKVPPYKLDTAVVYNQVYDSITQNDEIKLIVIGDNPGKEEQMAEKRSYLVGQAGRIAQGFFSRNQELGGVPGERRHRGSSDRPQPSGDAERERVCDGVAG